MKQRGIVLLDKGSGREITERLCHEKEVNIALLDDLVQMQLDFIGRERRRGLTERLDELFGQYLDLEE
ncbi:MAG: hypothetical protein ACKO6N_00735 [Myxococcota bacterium]